MFFSIIIPVYNAETTIDRCLRSILRQSESSFEIVIVNDCSIDKSDECCKEYCKKNSNVTLLQTAHVGVSGARNLGIRSAKGEYLLFIDADDTIEIDMLKNIKNVVENKVVELCYMNSHYVVSEKNRRRYVVFKGVKDSDKIYYSRTEFLNMITTSRNIFPGSMWLIVCKREFVIKHNMWLDEKLEWSEDSDFSYNVFVHGNQIAVCDYSGYNYFIDSSGSTSKDVTLAKIFGRMDIYTKWYNYFTSNQEAIKHFKEKERLKMAQQMLDNYCLYLFQIGTFFDEEINSGLFKKLCLEEKIWKSSTNSKFLFYRVVGLRVGKMKNIVFRKTRNCIEKFLGKKI